jgi:hypothetical protein
VVAKAEGMDDSQKNFHECAKAAHDAAAGQHDGMAEECSKAMDAVDLNKLVPTGVSVVAPTRPAIAAVPRFGSKGMPVSVVSPELSKILGTSEEDLHSDERSLA